MEKTSQRLFAESRFFAIAGLLAIVGIGGIACTQSPTSLSRPGSIALWEKNKGVSLSAREDQTPWDFSRKPAGSGGAACFSDDNTGPSLRKRIMDAERAADAGARNNSVWHGIRLSDFSGIQAQFLVENEKWIHTQGIDFTGCANVPCVYNRIYGVPDDSDHGWYAWGWYLKMGSVVAAQEYLPDWRKAQDAILRIEGKTYKDFLFTYDELKWLYILSRVLPPVYSRLPNWKSIHRVPYGQQSVLGQVYASGIKTDDDVKKEKAAKAEKADKDGKGTKDKKDGQDEDEEKVERSLGGVCGLSLAWSVSYKLVLGYVIVGDDCLRVESNSFGGTSLLWMVGHEHNHNIDVTLGNRVGVFRLSETEEWKNFSGWKIETVTDPETKQVSQRWAFDKAKDGFVRDYAATNPIEDFAETIAQFRFMGNNAVRVSPAKSAYVSKKLYGNRYFDEDGLKRYYHDYAYSGLSKNLSRVIARCYAKSAADQSPSPQAMPNTSPGSVAPDFENHGKDDGTADLDGARNPSSDSHAEVMPARGPTKKPTPKKSPTRRPSPPVESRPARRPVSRLSLTTQVEPEIVNCIETAVDNMIAVSFDELKSGEFEACNYINYFGDDIQKNLFERISPEVSKLLANEIGLAELNKALVLLKQRLEKSVDPREVYLHTFRQPGPEEVFNSTLAAAFDQVAAPLADKLGEALPRERARYLEENSFQKTAVLVNMFFSQVFGGAKAQVREAADRKWKQCMESVPVAGEAANSDRPLLLTPFSGGNHFVSASILSCVNESAQKEVESIALSYATEINYQLVDPDVQAYVQDLLLTEYLTQLKSSAEISGAEEDRARESRKQGVVDVIVGQLLVDLSWIENAQAGYSAVAVSQRCEVAGARVFDEYVSKLSPDQQIPTRFEAIENVRLRWSREACGKAVRNPEVIRMVQFLSTGNATDGKVSAQDLEKLEGVLLGFAQATVRDCQNSGPQSWLLFRGGAIARSLATSCVTDAWPNLETRALSQWLASPDGTKFANQRAQFSRYLESRRGVLQDYVLTQAGLKGAP